MTRPTGPAALTTAALTAAALAMTLAACGSNHPSGAPAASSAPSGSASAPTGSASAPTGSASSASSAPRAVQGWPFVGDRSVAAALPDAAVVLAAFDSAVRTAWGHASDLHPQWAGVTSSGQRVVLVTALAGNHVLAGVWVTQADGTQQLLAAHDIEAAPAQVSAVVPSADDPTVGTAIVVGQPGVEQVLYLNPVQGATWQPVAGTDGGRAVSFPLKIPKPFQPVSQIMVLGPGRDRTHPLYTGPIGRGITFPDV